MIRSTETLAELSFPQGSSEDELFEKMTQYTHAYLSSQLNKFNDWFGDDKSLIQEALKMKVYSLIGNLFSWEPFITIFPTLFSQVEEDPNKGRFCPGCKTITIVETCHTCGKVAHFCECDQDCECEGCMEDNEDECKCEFFDPGYHHHNLICNDCRAKLNICECCGASLDEEAFETEPGLTFCTGCGSPLTEEGGVCPVCAEDLVSVDTESEGR